MSQPTCGVARKCSGDFLPPPPPNEKAAARPGETGKACAHHRRRDNKYIVRNDNHFRRRAPPVIVCQKIYRDFAAPKSCIEPTIISVVAIIFVAILSLATYAARPSRAREETLTSRRPTWHCNRDTATRCFRLSPHAALSKHSDAVVSSSLSLLLPDEFESVLALDRQHALLLRRTAALRGWHLEQMLFFGFPKIQNIKSPRIFCLSLLLFY
jgi:hypothetical protein